MRKFTEIFGFVLAIIIAYSSIALANHFQGGAILMVLGLGILLLPFLILFTINSYKEKKPIIPIIIVCLSTSLYLTGFLFVVLHLQGGSSSLHFGLIFLLTTLFILGIIELFKQPINRRFSIITISFIIMAASLLYAATYRTVGRSVIDGLISANENIMKNSKIITDINKVKYDLITLPDTNKSDIYISLRDTSNEFVEQIEDLKNQMITYANGRSDFSDYYNNKKISSTDISNIFMLETRNAKLLKELIANYREFIHSNDRIFCISPTIEYLLNTDAPPPTIYGEIKSWEESKFLDKPLICAISNLSEIQLNIRTCELLLLNQRE